MYVQYIHVKSRQIDQTTGQNYQNIGLILKQTYCVN